MTRFQAKIVSLGFTSLFFICLMIPISEVAFAQTQRQDQPKKNGQRKNQGQNPNQKKGGNQEKGQAKKGPKHVFAGPAPEHPFDLILARPTDKSITISLLAYKPLEAYFEYGEDGNSKSIKTDVRKLQPDQPLELILGDLKASTKYNYTLYTKTPDSADFKASPQQSFHTQRLPGSSFTFTVQADSHLDQSATPSVYERTLANMVADSPDLVVDLGDTFMTDKYPNFKDSLPQYIAQRYYFGQIGKTAPVFLVLGNHDGERLDKYDATKESMAVWSNLTRTKYFPNPIPDEFYTGNQIEMKPLGKLQNYFAWTWGDAQFIVLDPFWTTARNGRGNTDGNWVRTLGNDQYHWLEKTLNESKSKYKFVFIHHLVGGLDESARGGSEAAAMYEWGGQGAAGMDEFRKHRPDWSMPIHQLLVKNKVSVVFHGHDHFFAKQDLDGVVYLLVPQPGHSGFQRLRTTEEYGYRKGDFLPPAGHMRVKVTPENSVVDYVRSYLPENENADRKNRDVSYSFKIAN